MSGEIVRLSALNWKLRARVDSLLRFVPGGSPEGRSLFKGWEPLETCQQKT